MARGLDPARRIRAAQAAHALIGERLRRSGQSHRLRRGKNRRRIGSWRKTSLGEQFSRFLDRLRGPRLRSGRHHERGFERGWRHPRLRKERLALLLVIAQRDHLSAQLADELRERGILAALEALAAIPAQARAALEVGADDAEPAVRRRAAALAVALGVEDLAARLTADEDASVRGAAAAARMEAPAPVEVPMRVEAPAGERTVLAAAPSQATLPMQPRDPVRAALRRLVLEGGSR